MKIRIAIAFGVLGLLTAIAVRLMPWGDHPHAQGPAVQETSVNLLQQPLRDMADQPASLAALKEPLLLVNFWATWCAPCLREIPLLQQAQRQHGIQTVGISYEEMGTIKAFTEQHPVAYALFKSNFDIFYFMQQQGNKIAILPYTVLIDGSGRVIDTKLGDFKTVEEIVKFTRREERF